MVVKDAAEVKLWGKTVGAIKWESDQNIGSFEYDTKFLQYQWDLSPIKMPLAKGRQVFSFPELIETKTFNGLPGLLADSLPDDYGNALVWMNLY